jgi:hypothetical protein
MSHNAYHRWTELEESVAVDQIILGEAILDENLENEKKMSRYSAIDNYWYASLSIDCGWLKRSSGRRYDSNKGHSIVVGNMTRKVVSIHCMSKVCAKCKINQEHPPAMCPKNWEGSSKAMEGHGVVVNAKLLYTKCVIIDELVMDDDSLTTTLLKPMVHRTLKTGRVETKGALPEDYPKTPTNLADTNHRIKCLSAPDWGSAYDPLGISTWTTADAAVNSGPRPVSVRLRILRARAPTRPCTPHISPHRASTVNDRIVCPRILRARAPTRLHLKGKLR